MSFITSFKNIDNDLENKLIYSNENKINNFNNEISEIDSIDSITSPSLEFNDFDNDIDIDENMTNTINYNSFLHFEESFTDLSGENENEIKENENEINENEINENENEINKNEINENENEKDSENYIIENENEYISFIAIQEGINKKDLEELTKLNNLEEYLNKENLDKTELDIIQEYLKNEIDNELPETEKYIINEGLLNNEYNVMEDDCQELDESEIKSFYNTEKEEGEEKEEEEEYEYEELDDEEKEEEEEEEEEEEIKGYRNSDDDYEYEYEELDEDEDDDEEEIDEYGNSDNEYEYEELYEDEDEEEIEGYGNSDDEYEYEELDEDEDEEEIEGYGNSDDEYEYEELDEDEDEEEIEGYGNSDDDYEYEELDDDEDDDYEYEELDDNEDEYEDEKYNSEETKTKIKTETETENTKSFFDWKQYLHNYPDLTANGINNKEKSLAHWNLHGKKEGRTYNKIKNNDINDKNIYNENNFDWKRYLNMNVDLYKNGVRNKYQAWNHWLFHGQFEGRKYFHLNATEYDKFDWERYIKNNADLSHNITKKDDAWYHWVHHGKEEGRSYFSNDQNENEYDNFNWKNYVFNYGDLSGIKNKDDAWYHWIHHGKEEGRSYFSNDQNEYENFNWKNYVSNYGDLSGIKNKDDAWYHWIHHGKEEGRVSNNLYLDEIKEYVNDVELVNINGIYFKQKYDRYGVHLFGWKGVINNFIEWFKNTPSKTYKQKIFFDEWIEKLLVWGNKLINEKYINDIKNNDYKLVTFIHNPPFLIWNDKTQREKISTEMIVTDNLHFNENIFNEINKNNLIDKTIFFYTLSINHKEYLINTYPEIKDKIVSVHHPLNMDTIPDKMFNIDKFINNKKIYNIGWWLRNFKTFIDFFPPTDFKKIILVKNDFLKSFNKTIAPNNNLSTVNIITEIDDDEYSNIFTNSCIFADITDCIANNTILECIKFNTPIILRRTKAAEEYLGIHYPLFFTDTNELDLFTEESFLLDLIIQSHHYLKNMNKIHLSLDTFNAKIQYDFKKLSYDDHPYKLSWVWFVNNETELSMEKLLTNFLDQKNNNEITLLIFINHQSPLLELLKTYNKKNENIKIILVSKNYSNVSFSKKIKFASDYINSDLIILVNTNIIMEPSFSSVTINYMKQTYNCDLGVCSFVTINHNNKTLHNFLKGEFFFQKQIEENNLENIGIVLRKNIVEVLVTDILKNVNHNKNFLLNCIENNLNIRCISEKTLFSILK